MMKDLELERLDAYFRESEAELEILQAQAEARKAQEEMIEISGLRAVREQARQKFADMKQKTSDVVESTRKEVEAELHDLEIGIERVRERYTAWNDAFARSVSARLDEADAKLRMWKARLEQKHAQLGLERQEVLRALEERTALTKERAAEWNSNRHNYMAQLALEDAARKLDEAFDAASKQYDT